MANTPSAPNLQKNPKGTPPKNNNKQDTSGWLFWVALTFIFLIMMSQSNTVSRISTPKELSYSEFYSILKENPDTSKIKKLELVEGPEYLLKGTFSDGTDFRVNI